jgi:hypothetical protein
MSSRPLLVFPDDMLQAMSLRDTRLAFSTIQIGDENPQKSAGTGGAEGSVGLLVDIGKDTTIEDVFPGDSGSSEYGSTGCEPTEQNCAMSIDARTSSNEWGIKNYVPIGIFVLPPIYVPTVVQIAGEPTRVESSMELGAAIAPFPSQRVFGTDVSSFLEFDRLTGNWRRIAYDEIISR